MYKFKELKGGSGMELTCLPWYEVPTRCMVLGSREEQLGTLNRIREIDCHVDINVQRGFGLTLDLEAGTDAQYSVDFSVQLDTRKATRVIVPWEVKSWDSNFKQTNPTRVRSALKGMNFLIEQGIVLALLLQSLSR